MLLLLLLVLFYKIAFKLKVQFIIELKYISSCICKLINYDIVKKNMSMTTTIVCAGTVQDKVILFTVELVKIAQTLFKRV